MAKSNKKIRNKFQSVGEDHIRSYLNEIGRFERIKPEQEVLLSRRIQKGVMVMEGLKKRFASLITDEDQKSVEESHEANPSHKEHNTQRDLNILLEKRIEDGIAVNADWASRVSGDKKATILDGVDARNELVNTNLRLVVIIAKRYSSEKIGLLDLIQAGNQGLMRAARDFMPEAEEYKNKGKDGKCIKFSSYASWWIKMGIKHLIEEQSCIIRTPAKMVKNIRDLGDVSNGIMQRTGRKPTVEELAEVLGADVKKIESIIDASGLRSIVSLDKQARDNGGRVSLFADTVKYSGTDSLCDDAILSEDYDRLREAFNKLGKRDQTILKMRHGFGGYKREYVLHEVGECVGGVSAERVRQLQDKAMSKLVIFIAKARRSSSEMLSAEPQ